MARRRSKPRFEDLPKTYRELVDLLPPRPIHSEREHGRVQAMIDVLALHDLNRDQKDYLAALTTFFEAYEDEHHRIDTSHIGPMETLRFLMEQSGMTASDLGRLLGDRSLGSRILSGERELSKAHIQTLVRRFRVSPELFFPAVTSA